MFPARVILCHIYSANFCLQYRPILVASLIVDLRHDGGFFRMKH